MAEVNELYLLWKPSMFETIKRTINHLLQATHVSLVEPKKIIHYVSKNLLIWSRKTIKFVPFAYTVLFWGSICMLNHPNLFSGFDHMTTKNVLMVCCTTKNIHGCFLNPTRFYISTGKHTNACAFFFSI